MRLMVALWVERAFSGGSRGCYDAEMVQPILVQSAFKAVRLSTSRGANIAFRPGRRAAAPAPGAKHLHLGAQRLHESRLRRMVKTIVCD